MKDVRMDILTLTDQLSIWNAACGFLGRALPLAGGASVMLRLSEPCAETAFWSEEASSGICARLEMLDFAGLTGEAFDMASLSALDPELSDEIARAGLAALLPLWGRAICAWLRRLKRRSYGCVRRSPMRAAVQVRCCWRGHRRPLCGPWSRAGSRSWQPPRTRAWPRRSRCR